MLAALLPGCGDWTSQADRRPPPVTEPAPTDPVKPGGKIAATGATEKTGAYGPGAAQEPAPSPGASKHWPRRALDADAAAEAGIRKLAGPRLTLYTDLPANPEIDNLPAIFEQAFAQWCAYFGVDPGRHAKWNVVVHLIGDKRLFRRAGFLPADLPPFPNAYCRHDELWVYEPPSEYYRRHLLLHEGTHAFMYTTLGSCGPPWYMEGVAELLATHRWHDGRLTMGCFPARREEVPHWGRIKAVRDDVAAQRARSLRTLMDFRPTGYGGDDMYPWVWAAAAFFDGHPRYRERFRRLPGMVNQRDFNQQFVRLLGGDMPRASDEWQVFSANVEYGYDFARTAIEFGAGRRLDPDGAKVRIAADRGWQCTGVRLEADRAYRLRASGRYQVADQPEIWWSEPNGVSIRYYGGRPLGLLVAAVRPDAPQVSSALLAPRDVGLETILTPKETGTLYLRINDSAAELHDNAGAADVEISAADQGVVTKPTDPSTNRPRPMGVVD
jgi:hypothetical protein